jgi:hypothetical protein
VRVKKREGGKVGKCEMKAKKREGEQVPEVRR